MKKLLMGVGAAILYFLPLFFSTMVFVIENFMYAAMFLPLSFFIDEPYRKWFRNIGCAMLGVAALGIVLIALMIRHR